MVKKCTLIKEIYILGRSLVLILALLQLHAEWLFSLHSEQMWRILLEFMWHPFVPFKLLQISFPLYEILGLPSTSILFGVCFVLTFVFPA